MTAYVEGDAQIQVERAKKNFFLVGRGAASERGLEIGTDLESASGKDKCCYEFVFCQLGYFCDSFGLALQDSPRVCFARPSCHGRQEETK